VELLVVLGVIALVAALVLPTAAGILTGGGDWQAYNMLSAQLVSARALAIKENTYAGVHLQVADAAANADLADQCFAAVVLYDPATQRFNLAPGFRARRVPGGMAFGRLTSDYVNASGDYIDGAFGNLEAFTTLTIVFSPAGQAVRSVGGANVIFVNTGLFAGSGTERLWNRTLAGGDVGLAPVTAVTMFSYKLMKAVAAGERDNQLNRSGQFLPVNVHTGQLFPR